MTGVIASSLYKLRIEKNCVYFITERIKGHALITSNSYTIIKRLVGG